MNTRFLEHQGTPFAGLSEEILKQEIEYYESRSEELALPRSHYERAMLMVYLTLADYRRRLLAAWRDGHPEDWMDYSNRA